MLIRLLLLNLVQSGKRTESTFHFRPPVLHHSCLAVAHDASSFFATDWCCKGRTILRPAKHLLLSQEDIGSPVPGGSSPQHCLAPSSAPATLQTLSLSLPLAPPSKNSTNQLFSPDGRAEEVQLELGSEAGTLGKQNWAGKGFLSFFVIFLQVVNLVPLVVPLSVMFPQLLPPLNVLLFFLNFPPIFP